jgi:hypothetical protein
MFFSIIKMYLMLCVERINFHRSHAWEQGRGSPLITCLGYRKHVVKSYYNSLFNYSHEVEVDS